MHTNNEKFKGTSVTQKEKYFNSNLIKNIRKSETYIKKRTTNDSDFEGK